MVQGLANKTSDNRTDFLLSLRKYFIMTASELKLRLFRQIDSLETSKLEEVYGILTNYLNGQKDLSDWDKLTDNQRHGILSAVEEIAQGKGIPNKVVLDKFRKKYSHA
jgi:hypothetical protein